MNLIQTIEQEEIARLTANKTIPSFAPGDTVVVSVRFHRAKVLSEHSKPTHH
jgi:ribosomal protein L19